MTDTRKWLIRRLRDARRMEKLSETMLARQAQRIEGYPALAGRIRQHIEQTKTEADRLHDLLEASGEHPVAERLASELVVLSEDLGSVLSGEEVMLSRRVV